MKAIPASLIVFAAVTLIAPGVNGQARIDFETRPPGVPTVDQEDICDEYLGPPWGVSFRIVDTNELEIGCPKIAKVGEPLTAFHGCGEPDADQPLPDQGVGASFLTDNDEIGVSGNLLVTYSTPVAAASGVIIDVDIHEVGVRVEQWTITARDASRATVAQYVLTAPTGEDLCPPYPGAGPGDGAALPWMVQSQTANIASLLIAYTGTADSGVGLAFDNFSPSPISDHFKCYKAKDLKSPKFEKIKDPGISLNDQFGDESDVDVIKPFFVCNPADKDGLGVNDANAHLCCYKIKAQKLSKPRPRVEISDQFGMLQLEAIKPQILCQSCSKTLLP